MEVHIPTAVAGSPSGISIVSSLTSTVNGKPTSRNLGQLIDERRERSNLHTLGETIAVLTLQDEEGGDRGYSDVEGEEMEVHGGNELDIKEKDEALEDVIIPDKDSNMKGFVKVTYTRTTNFIGKIGENASNLELISNITLPKPPNHFVAPPLHRVEESSIHAKFF